MRIFRVERENGSGPYSPLCDPGSFNMKDLWSLSKVLAEYEGKNEEGHYHPSPFEDGMGLMFEWDVLDYKSYLFGFKNLKDLTNWFVNTPEIISAASIGEFFVRSFEVEESSVVFGYSQVAFDRTVALRLDEKMSLEYAHNLLNND